MVLGIDKIIIYIECAMRLKNHALLAIGHKIMTSHGSR
jgi:hypothetical protein